MTTEKKNPRVNRVHRDLIFCGISDETLGVRKGDVGGSSPVTLIVGDNLHAVVLPDADTAVWTWSDLMNARDKRGATYE
jgi:hypothetical protein